MNLNHGATNFPMIDVAKVEETKKAKFVCELAIRGKFGWTDSPAQIYYQENPPNGYSNYFGLVYQNGELYIVSGASVVGIPIEAIQTPTGEIIWSRFRHDYRKAESADIFVDGGLDYLRYGGGDITKVKKVILTIKQDKLVVVEDEAEIVKLFENKTGITPVLNA